MFVDALLFNFPVKFVKRKHQVWAYGIINITIHIADNEEKAILAFYGGSSI
jgi:hypothetical protein